MTDIRFALAQIDTCVGDLDSNADKVMRYAHLAAQQGAQVVVFPEMTLTGYPIEDLALRATFRKAAWDKANWLATELASDSLGELYVVVGTVGTDRETSKPRNRLVVLHDAPGVGRDAVQPAVVAVDVDLVERSVPEPVAVHGLGQEDAPHPLLSLIHISEPTRRS